MGVLHGRARTSRGLFERRLGRDAMLDSAQISALLSLAIAVTSRGICFPPLRDWPPLRVYAPYPCVIGSHSGYMLPALAEPDPSRHAYAPARVCVRSSPPLRMPARKRAALDSQRLRVDSERRRVLAGRHVRPSLAPTAATAAAAGRMGPGRTANKAGRKSHLIAACPRCARPPALQRVSPGGSAAGDLFCYGGFRFVDSLV
eukprot:7372451-Pyramimonas_sp.AAC.1